MAVAGQIKRERKGSHAIRTVVVDAYPSGRVRLLKHGRDERTASIRVRVRTSRSRNRQVMTRIYERQYQTMEETKIRRCCR